MLKQTVMTFCLCSLLIGLHGGTEQKDTILQAPALLPGVGEEPKDTTKQNQAKLPAAKKITNGKMILLSDVLKDHPEGVVRMTLASNTIIKVLKDLESNKNPTNDQKIITGQIQSVLKPVRQFFDIIYDYGSIIRPLILESLFGIKIESTTEAHKVSTQYEDKCLLLGFLNAKNNRNTFFEDRVKTKEELHKTCIEFLQFFKDLNVSLSEPAIKAYKELMASIRKS